MNQSGYAPGSSSSAGVSPTESGMPGGYWTLERMKKAYLDYLANKRAEIDEQIEARRYYHNVQWTEDELKKLKKRNQPPVTFNRIGRKINGVVGLIEKMKTDPKAYPRTPKHEAGAELATAVLRYVLDQQQWDAKRPECVRDACIDGVAGIELVLEQGDADDKEVGFEVVEPDSFFYDPRSFRPDFSDARYKGVGKWADFDEVKTTFPDKKDEISSTGAGDFDLTSGSDRDNKWFISEGGLKRLRLVNIEYQHEGRWCWAIFTGSTILMEGESFFTDEKKKSSDKFLMWSCNVDHEGDRYGFVRGMKSAQDEINHRRSKALHKLSSRRLILTKGAVDDVEVARREWAKPDGVIMVNPGMPAGDQAIADDQQADFAGELALMENASMEIENFGFNPSLIGQGVKDMSGRAINLQQQAGIAELGPFTTAYKGWTLRVYRSIWNAVQKHWTGERFVRVTDDEDLAQFIQVNGTTVDPMTGQSTLVNALGSLDVDVILDEGPDTVNMMADAYDTLSIMASKGTQMPPQVLIELSPLPLSVKKKLNEIMQEAQQADPMMQQAKQVALAAETAKVEQTQADAGLKKAQTVKTMVEAELAPAKAQHDASLKEQQHIDQQQNTAMDRRERMVSEGAGREERFTMKAADLRSQEAERAARAAQQAARPSV